MGRYASVDWIQFAWDEQHGGLGPGRTSLERTAGWYHQLGPWLDPGPEPGVSLCRLLVDGRVVVLARTRTGGADSRRTIRVQAYLGGSADRPMAMPNVRQTLALAPGWAARLPDGDEPLDLGKLISSYDSARAALDRESRAAAPALAPIVAECLRRPGTPLSVASGGNPIVQLWGLVDILDYALGHYPETFSTYESDDLKPGAEIIFLRQWPGPSSQSSHRTRVDSRLPDQDDRYGEIAAMLVDAYAQDRLVGLVKHLRITDRTPLEERLRRLASATDDPTGSTGPPRTPASPPAPSPSAPSPSAPSPAVQAPGTHVAGQTAELQRPRAAGQAPGQAPGQVASQAPGVQQRPADTARAATAPAGTTHEAPATGATEPHPRPDAHTSADAHAAATTELRSGREARPSSAAGGASGSAVGGAVGGVPGGAAGVATGGGPGSAAGGAAAGGPGGGPASVAGGVAGVATGGGPGSAAGGTAGGVAGGGPGSVAGGVAGVATGGGPGGGPGSAAGGTAGGVAGGGAGGGVGGQRYAEQDVFEMLCTDLTQATSAKEVTAILHELRAYAARRQPAEVRARLPRLIPVLEALLPEAQINPFLRALLDPDAPSRPARSGWLDPKWLVIVVMLALLTVLVVVTLVVLV